MTKMTQIADEEMLKTAVDSPAVYEEMEEPANLEAPCDHKLWPALREALRTVYDPEIPVNIYELGLIYKVDIKTKEGTAQDGSKYDVYVQMTLTSPGCPVAQEMPQWVQAAIFEVDGVADAEVEIVWDPIWDPSMMSETAKLMLNMY